MQRIRSHLVAVAALPLLLPASADAFGPREVVLPVNAGERAAREKLGIADAVIADDGTIYLSGIPVAPAAGDADPDVAFARAFRRAANILQRSGSGLSDVAEITSYHLDLHAQMPAMTRAKSAAMAGPPPAWTAVGVTALRDPQAIAEIRIVARRSTPPSR